MLTGVEASLMLVCYSSSSSLHLGQKIISTREKTSGGIATGAAVAGRTAVAAVAVAALARAQVPAGRTKGVPVGEDEAPGARLAPGRLLVRALVVGGGAAAAHGGVGQIAHGLW
jgi:hypothetical protein